MVPDFLQNQIKMDMTTLNEKDMLQDALDKQDKKNQEESSGLSMAELAKRKRMETEKQIEESKAGPSKS